MKNNKSKSSIKYAFAVRRKEIEDMLTRLNGLCANNFNYDNNELDWAHVGTIASYASQLREVCDRAFQEGEYAEYFDSKTGFWVQHKSKLS